MKRLINLELTPYCPAKCSMCPRDLIKEFGYMSLETAQTIREQIQNIDDIWEISFAGRGEPTLHKNFSEIMKIFSGTKPISVVTTGANLNDSILDAFNKYVDRIRISVSSVDRETFEKIHVNLNYDKVFENINRIIENVDKDKIIIHLVGGETVYPKVPETVEYLRERGIKNIYIFPLWNRGGTKEQHAEMMKRKKIIDEYNLKPSEEEYLPTEFDASMLGNDYCLIGDLSLSINFKGEITCCFQDFGYSEIVGTVFNNDIKTIFENRSRVLGRMKMCNKCNSKISVIR